MGRLAKRQKAVRKSIIAGVSSVIPSQSVLVTQNTLLSIVNNAKPRKSRERERDPRQRTAKVTGTINGHSKPDKVQTNGHDDHDRTGLVC